MRLKLEFVFILFSQAAFIAWYDTMFMKIECMINKIEWKTISCSIQTPCMYIWCLYLFFFLFLVYSERLNHLHQKSDEFLEWCYLMQKNTKIIITINYPIRAHRWRLLMKQQRKKKRILKLAQKLYNFLDELKIKS